MVFFWQRDVRSFSLLRDVQAVLLSSLFKKFQLLTGRCYYGEEILRQCDSWEVNQLYVVGDGQEDAIFLDIGPNWMNLALSWIWPNAKVFESIYFLYSSIIMLLSVCVIVKFQLTRARV